MAFKTNRIEVCMNYAVSVLTETLYGLQAEREGFMRKTYLEERLVNSNDQLGFRSRRTAMLTSYDEQINGIREALKRLEHE